MAGCTVEMFSLFKTQNLEYMNITYILFLHIFGIFATFYQIYQIKSNGKNI